MGLPEPDLKRITGGTLEHYEKRAEEAEKHAEALRKILIEDRKLEELTAGAEG